MHYNLDSTGCINKDVPNPTRADHPRSLQDQSQKSEQSRILRQDSKSATRKEQYPNLASSLPLRSNDLRGREIKNKPFKLYSIEHLKIHPMSSRITNLPPCIKVDENIRPQDDLYGHACSHWLKNNPIPVTKSSWGHFSYLHQATENYLQHILKDWLKSDTTSLTKDQFKLVQYYSDYVHQYRHRSTNIEYLKEIRRKIYAIKSQDSRLAKAQILALAQQLGVELMLSVDTQTDYKNNHQYCLSIETVNEHGGYYVSSDTVSRRGRRAYLRYLKNHKKLLADLGLKYNLSPSKILQIEIEMTALDRQLESKDPRAVYNKFSLENFKKTFDFSWDIFFDALELKPPATINVEKPDVLTGFLSYINKLSIAEVKAYLFFQICCKRGHHLDKGIAKIDFDYFQRYRCGVEKQASLRVRAFQSTNYFFADVFGQEYIKRYFPPQHKEIAAQIAKDIRQAFATRLENNTWLSPGSKIYALEKLANIIINIGHSRHWRNYHDVQITKNQIVRSSTSIDRANIYAYLELLGQQTNRWRLGQIEENVQEISTYAHPPSLNIRHKAAMLQKPFFNPQATQVYNLATTGIIMGHELSHHFDTKGMFFGKDGNLKIWMTQSERTQLALKIQKLVEFANQHQPIKDYNLKGEQIIGEFMADLAGLEIALTAIKQKFKTGQGRHQALREAFIAYAYFNAANTTREAMIDQIENANHPPYSFRVNGVVSHCPDFYKVFNVKPTDVLYLEPDDRVQIW